MKEARKYLKILVVEDNPGDFVLIEEYLTEALLSPEIHHVQTYNEVENELNINTKFDVILLDLSLPDLSGESLVKNMVEISGFIPIVVLTGYENQDFGLKTLSMGVSDYLLKDEISPFLLGKVLAYSIERNKINQTLKTSEKQYRDLFDFSPQPMWVFDLKDLKF
ncbi:MAG: response regulator, partial [Candidatus Paceibacterota bacterium]